MTFNQFMILLSILFLILSHYALAYIKLAESTVSQSYSQTSIRAGGLLQ